MNDQNLLLERYEDALFALLMDELSVAEGKRLLEENERLNEDPAFEVPQQANQRCLRAISRHYSRQNLKTAGCFLGRLVNKIAVIILIGVLLFTTAFASSRTFRNMTLEFVTKVFESKTELRPTAYNISTESALGRALFLGWLPDDFDLVSQTGNDRRVVYVYQSDMGNQFEIHIIDGTSTVVSIDTENALVESLEVQASTAILSEKDDIIQILWSLEDEALFVKIKGDANLKDDLICIAQNLEIYS